MSINPESSREEILEYVAEQDWGTYPGVGVWEVNNKAAGHFFIYPDRIYWPMPQPNPDWYRGGGGAHFIGGE